MTDKNTHPWWSKDVVLRKSFSSGISGLTISALTPIVALAVLIGGTLSYAAFSPDPARPVPAIFNSVENPASIDGVIAKCGGVFVFDINRNHYGVIPNSLGTLPQDEIPMPPMLIPVYGYMNNNGVDVSEKKFFTVEDNVEITAILRSMYHGLTVIWYSDSMSKENIESIQTYVARNDEVIAVPAPQEIPLGRSYGVSTWGVSQSCIDFSASLLNEFIKVNVPKTPGRINNNPPTALLTSDSMLQEINLVE